MPIHALQQYLEAVIVPVHTCRAQIPFLINYKSEVKIKKAISCTKYEIMLSITVVVYQK